MAKNFGRKGKIVMKSCKDCFHYNVCEAHQVDEREDKCANVCRDYVDEAQIIILPMKATRELLVELEDYCNKRCVDEL